MANSVCSALVMERRSVVAVAVKMTAGGRKKVKKLPKKKDVEEVEPTVTAPDQPESRRQNLNNSIQSILHQFYGSGIYIRGPDHNYNQWLGENFPEIRNSERIQEIADGERIQELYDDDPMDWEPFPVAEDVQGHWL